MNACCITVNGGSADSHTPSMRHLRFISKHFSIPFIFNGLTMHLYKDKYDILIVKYGILSFCPYREEFFEMYHNAKYIISIEDDYMFKIDYRFDRKADEVWTTLNYKKDPCVKLIDWNKLSWIDTIPNIKKKYTDGLFYYGSFREGRMKDFKFYFNTTLFNIYISTSNKNQLRFNSILHPDARTVFFPLLKQMNQIALFGTSLFIEDQFSHDNNCSLPNRFYECLGRGVALAIDSKCTKIFKSNGLAYENFVVETMRDVEIIIRKQESIQKAQYRLWKKDYIGIFKEQFKNSLKDSLVNQ